MKCFFKTVLIVGLVGIGTVGLAHVVLGKGRAHGAIKALQGMAQSEVDKLIASQNDMRTQLESLRSEYPKQIALLRSQSIEVERQLAALDRDSVRARDIINLCDADLNDIRNAKPDAKTAAISFRGSRYKPEQADALVSRVEQTRELYEERLADFDEQTRVLRVEHAAVQEQLASVREEQAEFEIQYQGLLREIERLSRNEESIRLAESRKAGVQGRHGETMNTLGAVKAAIERARIEQDERLRATRSKPADLDYEARAALHTREAKRATQPTAELPETVAETAESAELNDETVEPVAATK
ncbi:MAG: hypothetical protein IT462_10435 [Planctomycetes bacterium]|nr:hypothetical protein [Planctomycetota bacterium]